MKAISRFVSLLLVCISFLPLSSASAALIYEKNRNLCAGQPILTRKHEKALRWMMQNIGEAQIKSSTSPQHEAACWAIRSKKKFSPQRYVMGVIYYATKGFNWDINTLWMTNKHECEWYGVECNMFKTVIGLDLAYIKVEGLVPREIGLLTELKDLDLHGNDLQGVIPHRLMAGLKKLEYLRIYMNGMFGALHTEIAHMTNLKELYVFGNYLSGTMPKDFSKLKKLERIDAYANQLGGTIPKELAKIPKLRYLDLHDNNFVGTMPKEICDKNLDMLVADCHGRNPEVKCDCCHICCQGMPEMICVEKKTGKLVDYAF